MKEAKNNK